MADQTFHHRDPYNYGSGDVEKDTCNARHHKDSMQRYTSINQDESADRFLNPEDGKLGLLKVQLAPGYKQTHGGKYPKTWRLPNEINSFKRGWHAYRNAPRRIIRWTFGSHMSSKKSKSHTRIAYQMDFNIPAAGDNESAIYYKYPIACIALLVTVCTTNFSRWYFSF
jgi:hypothetical protein